MFIQPLDLSNLGNTPGSTTGTSASNATDPQASQDRFLKLLVAQLNNQDPLNPMDNAQMTTQMAQINTVSGIQELNATLKGMAAQFSSATALQGTSLIGREALLPGDTLTFKNGQGKAAFSLEGKATDVKVDIMGTNGEVIDTVQLGALGPGLHGFDWDAAGIDPATVKGFKVSAVDGGAAVDSVSLKRLSVDSVSFSGGSIYMLLQDGSTRAYNDVLAYM
ncbi:MAG: flagellar hook assembly protein FlgD [Hydrogenophaga sp.]|jgi:flagellar basal-body rod modification protein FlgD|uniref:flagellar hook assembly protein FlgD n=1 Tax=Hydrogenophaga sp. TaxID=1904254 RepID=UPI00261C9C4F|nr:flagellar hook capping FlgD N-terminal domain-containing protein [Hydrogenophaga sp.]MCV0441372.1 flagellar hook assembly protein FlgD [Hydrogenophaga sp.]